MASAEAVFEEIKGILDGTIDKGLSSYEYLELLRDLETEIETRIDAEFASGRAG